METPARGRSVRARRGAPATTAEPLPGDRTERLLRKLLRLGVCVVPVLPLHVSTSLLFPYVSGRNFAFRILTEVRLLPLAALCWLTGRPHRWLSPTTAALLTFLSWMGLADVRRHSLSERLVHV